MKRTERCIKKRWWAPETPMLSLNILILNKSSILPEITWGERKGREDQQKANLLDELFHSVFSKEREINFKELRCENPVLTNFSVSRSTISKIYHFTLPRMVVRQRIKWTKFSKKFSRTSRGYERNQISEKWLQFHQCSRKDIRGKSAIADLCRYWT